MPREQENTNPQANPQDQSSFINEMSRMYLYDSPNNYVINGNGISTRPPEPIPKLDTLRLKKATAKLLAERRPNNPRPNADPRQRDYISIVQHNAQRNQSSFELLNSERPVYLGYLEYDILKDLSRHTSDIRLDADSGRTTCICSKTGTPIAAEFAFMCGGRVYAADQVPSLEMCASCEYVRPDCHTIKDYKGNDMFVCNKCMSSRKRCKRCSIPLEKQFLGESWCPSCVEIPFEERPVRQFYRGVRWCGDKLGAIMQSPRIFSFEMEAVIRANALKAIGDTLPHEAGLGGDSSIQGGAGVEVQSPKLQGGRGEEFVTRVASVFKSVKAQVNESCGMHIHLDAAGFIPHSRKDHPKALVELWKAHLVFEDVIFSLLPFNRRLNHFCRPMRDYFKISELESIQTMFDAEKLWYKQQDGNSIRSEKQHHHHASRYFGVNLHSLFGSKNLELRHHTGTLNAKKVLHWANLHALIMDAAVAGKFTFEFLAEAQATSSLKDKTAMLFEVIGLSRTSQVYFLGRQARFSDKGQVEDGLSPIPVRKTLTINLRERMRRFEMISTELLENDPEL